MEIVYDIIGFLAAHPLVALALGIALLLVFLYNHPKIFFVLAVLAVVIYLVFSLSSVGVSEKDRLLKRSVSPENLIMVYPVWS